MHHGADEISNPWTYIIKIGFKALRLDIMQVYVTLFNFLFVKAVYRPKHLFYTLYMHKVGVNT